MAGITLKAEERKLFGRKVKQLRNDGLLPANIFGKGVKSKAIQVDVNDFENIFAKAGETNVLDLQVGKSSVPVLIHGIQKDPIAGEYLHADFLQVDLKQKVSAQVPIVLANESPAEKQGLGTVVQYFDEIEVEALPTDLPEKFEVDLSQLTKADQEINVKDLKYDKKKIEIEIDAETVLVKVEPPREEEEESATVLTEDTKEEKGEEVKEAVSVEEDSKEGKSE